MQWEAQVMVEGLKQIQQTIQATEEKIQELCSQLPEYPYLLSIPGFGPQVSSQVLGAIGDPCRFQNGKQVLKMAGLDLSADRSGKTSAAATPVISKKADLRYALYQAALIASIKNRSFMVYYTHKLRGRAQEKGIQTKMRVKLAAKLLLIAWTLIQRKEPLDPKLSVGPKVHKATIKRGLFTRVKGDSYLLAPPLIITEAEVDQIVNILGEAIQEVAKEVV